MQVTFLFAEPGLLIQLKLWGLLTSCKHSGIITVLSLPWHCMQCDGALWGFKSFRMYSNASSLWWALVLDVNVSKYHVCTCKPNPVWCPPWRLRRIGRKRKKVCGTALVSIRVDFFLACRLGSNSVSDPSLGGWYTALQNYFILFKLSQSLGGATAGELWKTTIKFLNIQTPKRLL